METVEKKYSPELRWTLFKIRLLDEDDAAEVLESYAKEHAREISVEFAMDNLSEVYKAKAYHDVTAIFDKWYTNWQAAK